MLPYIHFLQYVHNPDTEKARRKLGHQLTNTHMHIHTLTLDNKVKAKRCHLKPDGRCHAESKK